MAQTDPHSPPDSEPCQRPKNREVENEMIGGAKASGQPPRSATEPAAEAQNSDEDGSKPKRADGRKSP